MYILLFLLLLGGRFLPVFHDNCASHKSPLTVKNRGGGRGGQYGIWLCGQSLKHQPIELIMALGLQLLWFRKPTQQVLKTLSVHSPSFTITINS